MQTGLSLCMMDPLQPSQSVPIAARRQLMDKPGGGSSLGSLGGLGASPGAMLHENGEYTFTDKELQDILVFLEHQNKPGKTDGFEPPVPAVLGGVSGSPSVVDVMSQLPMQFQPHNPNISAEMARHHAAQQMPMQMHPHQQSNFVKQESFGNRPGRQQSLLHSGLAVAQPPVYSQSLSMKELYPTQSQAWKTELRSPTAAGGATGSGLGAGIGAGEPKTQISHSTVEKQRRDRINSLIDELREIVPPQTQGNNNGSDASDVKRPKHVVLSDTILLLKKLQSQGSGGGKMEGLDDSEGNSMDSRGVSKHLLGLNLRGDLPMSGAHREPSPELPMPPKGQNANGVVVESGDGCMLVRVSCKDRRGLLSDVISSLKCLDLEITTAAITTNGEGTVHDVFEVIPAPHVSAEDIQCHVHACVYNRFNNNEKRLRDGFA